MRKCPHEGLMRTKVARNHEEKSAKRFMRTKVERNMKKSPQNGPMRIKVRKNHQKQADRFNTVMTS